MSEKGSMYQNHIGLTEADIEFTKKLQESFDEVKIKQSFPQKKLSKV